MRIGLGCVGLGSGAGRPVFRDVELVRQAVELGVRVFDTADAYGNGASERVLGRALRGRRDDVVIATKGGFVFRERSPAAQWARRYGKWALQRAQSGGLEQLSDRAAALGGPSYAQQDFSPAYLRRAVHASLQRLRTDRIDVYQLHGPGEVHPDVIGELADLSAVGDVGRFGIGADSVPAADDWSGVAGIDVLHVPFGVLGADAASTTFGLARRHGKELWVRGVLGGGALTATERGAASPTGDPTERRVARLREVAREAGLDLAQLAFGFVKAYPSDISTVLVGTSSSDHLRRNFELLEAPPLPSDVLAAVLEVAGAVAEQP